jgi:hypothetical protein
VSFSLALGVTIVTIAVAVIGRSVGLGPGRLLRISRDQFFFGLVAVTVAYVGVVALLNR